MDQTEQIQVAKTPKFLPKTLTAMQMIDNGVDPKTALQLVNNKDKIHPQTVHNLKQNYKKYSLTRPKLVKAAHNQVQRILAAEPREITQQKVTKSGEVVEVIEVIAPSDTNILAAASMVYDRYEPVVKADAGNTINNTMIISPELSDLIGMMRSGNVERADSVIDVQLDNQPQITSSTMQDLAATNDFNELED